MKSRRVYLKSYFELTKRDLISMAKAKAKLTVVKSLVEKFAGDEDIREDMLIYELGKLPGLEPFSFFECRLPGISNQMAADQQAKLREAAKELLTSLSLSS